MPRRTSTRRGEAGGQQQVGQQEVATAALAAEPQQLEGAAKTKTISDAVTRRVKAAVGVQNLTWSEGIAMPAGLPNEARAEVMAQMYLLHCGFGNDANFEAASETLGWALAEL